MRLTIPCHTPLLIGKITPNQLDSGLTLKSVQDKYEDFISETSSKTFQSSIIYGAVGSNIVIIVAITISVILCSHNLKYPSWHKKTKLGRTELQ